MNRILIMLAVLFIPATQSLGAWSVWTESMLIDKPLPTYNPSQKTTSISLKGAKNEWVGFLICVRGDESLKGFVPSVKASFTNGTSTIGDNNALFYILHNHYVDEFANAYEPPASWPDAAVPYRDVYFNEVRNGTEAGWGQTVPSSTTKVFFVELYIPSSTEAGSYAGTISLQSNSGALSQDITVSLDVWDFTLPEQWTLKNLWGVYGHYTAMDATAFGARNDTKAREYLFNLQKASLNHGFFLYGTTGRLTSGPTTTDSFTDPYFDGANDSYSWKRFLDGTAPQAYNPKPYPITSIWGTRDESGSPLINKSTTTMDKWAQWITSNNYDKRTVFFDKIIDEPDMSSINARHTEHVNRHAGSPSRPFEYWTAGDNSYPPESSYWNDAFKSVWMVSQFYTWYRAHDWGEPHGSPTDFAGRISQYGDLLFSYTAGDNDHACDIGTYDASRGIRTAASSSIDAYSRQNAYMFLSDWHFGTAGHHFWMVNEGWQNGDPDYVWTETSPFGKWKRDGMGYPESACTAYNGDGIYFYPGRPSGTNHDIGGTREIPIESFRLKLVRWGAQVYEYANILKNQGSKNLADAEVARMITFHLPNKITIHPVSEWESARMNMGHAISPSDRPEIFLIEKSQ